ncbi:MAG TPA: hypothetical protein VGR50_03100, partial [Terriglobales bacterium]|nr:hypothetical protein [Terriglobales bacterium]
ELLTIAMVWVSLLFDAPLEQLADPMHTPNPAKAPWYFLGLQELLHYFPPVVAGVLIPGLVVVALIVIPYFDVNIESEGFWLRGRTRKLQVFGLVVGALAVLLFAYHVYPVLIPTMLVAVFMLWAAFCAPHAPSPTQRWLAAKPLSYWIMTWFLINLVVLTAIGTYFRGPGWSWVWPWTTY